MQVCRDSYSAMCEFQSEPTSHSHPQTRSSGVVTVISSADLADSELGGAREDRRSKVPEFMLTVQSMELIPGENRFIVEGKVRICYWSSSNDATSALTPSKLQRRLLLIQQILFQEHTFDSKMALESILEKMYK